MRSRCVKWLSHRIGDKRYLVSKNDHIGNYILKCLRLTPFNWRPAASEGDQEYFSVMVTDRYTRDPHGRGMVINQQDARMLDNWVAGMINEEMYAAIETGKKYGVEIRLSIFGFLSKYDFNDADLTYQNARKIHQRMYELRQKAEPETA